QSKPLGRATEMQLFCDRDETSQLADIHGVAPLECVLFSNIFQISSVIKCPNFDADASAFQFIIKLQ
ncbi:MAG: hypothetical protein ACRDBH_12740, partial [Bosea sp. (in: a-proteobacteria)]